MNITAALGLATASLLLATPAAPAQPVPPSAVAEEQQTLHRVSTCPEVREHPQIRQGSTGTAVRHAQCLLQRRAGYHHVQVDGIFGPITDAATRDVQRRCGIARDGIIGPQTWACLHSF